MDHDGEIVTQLGLLLTQMGYARQALENIERATARYTGIALNLGEGGRPFGAPPMLDGALKVYVINLGDLLADRSGPGLLEGLLGGAGRFLGGLIGGAAGGFLGGLAFPYDLAQVAAITKSVAEILERLGSDPDPKKGGFWAHLSEVITLVDKIRKLFTDTASTPAKAAPPAAPPSDGGLGPPPLAWLATLQALHQVIDGLTRLVPLVAAALADVLFRLSDIRAAVAGFLDFAVEGALLLRGVILVTVFDTIAAAADLAAQVLTLLGTASSRILTSVVTVVDALLDVGISGLALLGAGLKETVDDLMRFLRDGVGNLLLFLGDTRVFRVIVHLVDVLPLVLPALLRLFGKSLTEEETKALSAAARVATAAPAAGFTGPPAAIAPFPDIGADALRSGPLRTFQTDLKTASLAAVKAVHDGISTATTASQEIAKAARASATGADARLDADLAGVKSSANQLSDAFAKAEERTAVHPDAGLEAVATAYETWLGKDGMHTLLGALNRELAASAAGPEGATGLAGRITAASGEGQQATVQVNEVIVDLTGATSPGTPEPRYDLEDIYEGLRAHERSLEERRGTVPVP
jgi:hypothetical protein